MTDQEANEIERREWAEKMAKREAESNANFGAGVSSLDSHIMDVEASGEDKKHEAFEPVLDDISEGEMAAAIRTLRGMGYYWNGGMQWRPTIGEKPNFDLIDLLRNQNDAILQAIADPENQPSQFGTVTVEFMEAAVRAERERCILACIDVSNEHQGNANRSHEQAQYEARDYFQAKAHAAAKCAGAIKGLKP